MHYLVCEKCGGYYELQEGESLDKFSECQCGGSLTYVDSVDENVEDEQKVLYCLNCGNYDMVGVYCSKCGGRLYPIEKYGDINNEALLKIKEDFKKEEINNYPEKMIDRISLTGILFGVIFLIFTSFFFVLKGLAYRAYQNPQMGYITIFKLHEFTAAMILFIGALVVSSGGIAAYMGNSREYGDGIIHGFLVGFIFALLLIILNGFLRIFADGIHGIALISGIYVILSSFGGIMSVYFRKMFQFS